jgi:hypothetical protein
VVGQAVPPAHPDDGRFPRPLRACCIALALLQIFSPPIRGADASGLGYAGTAVCASCHKEIAASQAQTAMATTWHGGAAQLPVGYHGRATEGSAEPLAYEIERRSDGFVFSARMPDGVKTNLPVKVVMGGARHGLSFLLSIETLGGIP